MCSFTSSEWRNKLAEITPLYSELDVLYNNQMSGVYDDVGWDSEDCLVIAGLKDGRISGFWRPMVALGKPEAVEAQMERLWSISHNIFYVDFLEGGGNVSVAGEFLLRKGLPARPFFTQVIDLTKSEAELHADLRKSYKSLCNKIGDKDHLAIRPRGCGSDRQKESEANSFIDKYKVLHKSFGTSRLDETWEVQKKQMAFGEMFGVIVCEFGCNENNNLVQDLKAGLLCLYNKNSCYYFSGKSHINSHPLLWQAILYAKKLGCKRFEMGEQVFNKPQEYYDKALQIVGSVIDEKVPRFKEQLEKEQNISHFKAGFGGHCEVRLLIGE